MSYVNEVTSISTETQYYIGLRIVFSEPSMKLSSPFLLFIGDATDPLSIKMAKSAADWSPENCVGEFSLPECTVTTGLQQLTIEQAKAEGAKSFVLGFANSGGTLEDEWIPAILQALDAGFDIVSGLHQKLTSVDVIAQKSKALNLQLVDIRHPQQTFKTANGIKRTGKRLLTVGTDCSVGKMYTSLSLKRAMDKQNIANTFRATGQSGILISGNGVAVDCVVSDFISGAVESLSPNADKDHWDIIEGQGSLSHPAFAGVSLGLLHGSQPDALVICHAVGREHMRGLKHFALPTIEQTIQLNQAAAKLTNPEARVVGISINSSAVDTQAARNYCKELEQRIGLPTLDPFRHDINPILENLL
jgi:uncharacterized NAD-dependent epimerase/dehydratase family protein